MPSLGKLTKVINLQEAKQLRALKNVSLLPDESQGLPWKLGTVEQSKLSEQLRKLAEDFLETHDPAALDKFTRQHFNKPFKDVGAMLMKHFQL